MKPLVCEYLLTHTLSQLEEDHGVKHRFNASGDRFSLNYDQLKVRNGDPVAEQCRGLILQPMNPITVVDSDDRAVCVIGRTEVLAWPFNRFYNMHEDAVAPVDWSDPNLKVLEKLDGTMCVLYWDGFKWCVATRSVPEADLPIHSNSIMAGTAGDLTYADLFWRSLEETVLEENGRTCCGQGPEVWVDQNLLRFLTYVFELTTPLNRIVVGYPEYRATLISARNTRTGREIDITSAELARPGRLKIVSSWASLSEPRALSDFVNMADPAKLEGAVVVDSQFRRMKVKNKAWVLSSKAKDLVTVSRRRAVESILAGTVDDVIPLVETDIANELKSLRMRVLKYLESVDKNFIAYRELAAGDRKQFAAMVLESGDWATPYFQLLDGRAGSAVAWAQELAKAEKMTSRGLETILERAGRIHLSQ